MVSSRPAKLEKFKLLTSFSVIAEYSNFVTKNERKSFIAVTEGVNLLKVMILKLINQQ